MKTFLISILITAVSVGLLPAPVCALTAPNKFVRTANYFLISGPKLDDPNTLNTLAEFDLIVLPAEAQVYNTSFFSKIRAKNPDIIILAYVPTVSWNHLYWNDPLHNELKAGISGDWWLKDASGNIKSVWPNTSALNLNSGWKDYLASFVSGRVISTGLWDGVFYDEVQDSIDWVGAIDNNQNFENDNPAKANARWAEAYKSLFEKTRSLVGNNKIIITNGSSNPAFAPYVNGRMFENFPVDQNQSLKWKNQMNDYLGVINSVAREDITIVNANTSNLGNPTDYRKVRYGITSTLLSNGYFAFDFGDQNHGQLWTYDEYNAVLGKPLSSANNELGSSNYIYPSVWSRDFTQGKVIVNATDTNQTIKLNGDYEKIHGTQDTSVNNGSIVNSITLASNDGIILLRPIEQIFNAVYRNGAFARVFSLAGETKRNGFFAYDSFVRGGQEVIRYDIDLDGSMETIVADKTFIYIYEHTGALHAKFAPYTTAYKLGINFALGDLENDGSVEIVTGTEKGGGPQMRIFNKDGNLIHPGFFAYDKNFRGGVKVAVGDLNGDGTKEIITSPGVSGGPHIRVFHKDGHALQPGFFAYDSNFKGGVFVASGDVNGDGKDEIITGPGAGGGPHVKIFNLEGEVLSQFFSADAKQNKGVRVTVADLDGDSTDEIISLSTDVFTISF
ncbi:MAG: putative glycoside hydrolase [Patescibacteria group bacterium]